MSSTSYTLSYAGLLPAEAEAKAIEDLRSFVGENYERNMKAAIPMFKDLDHAISCICMFGGVSAFPVKAWLRQNAPHLFDEQPHVITPPIDGFVSVSDVVVEDGSTLRHVYVDCVERARIFHEIREDKPTIYTVGKILGPGRVAISTRGFITEALAMAHIRETIFTEIDEEAA